MTRSAAALVALVFVLGTPATAQEVSIETTQLEGLRFRQPGPAVTGGRIHDVEALPHDPSTIYVATASGGLWKTTNKGTTWTPLFDDQPVSTFGDIAIAPSDPNVIWAGTGEQQNRQSTSWGNGVYRSRDGGTTWTHLGLADTRHISRVHVHPRDANTAYVAALGNLWRASEDRGLYKTTDGGRTWSKVLYVDPHTGVIDLVMDPDDPNVLYAATYQRLRRTWGFNGGGPGSGIHKTEDGGQTWRELTDGLPTGDKGRIGLAIAATDGRILNALVQHPDEGGTYRTTNGGRSWERVNTLNRRPMYYSHIVLDPTNADRVYALSTTVDKSEDGGTSFRRLPTNLTYDVGVHSDFHALWIDPRDPEHFYLGGDGGLWESWDGGETYMKINNLPIAQIYAMGVDHAEPYNIYLGLQDNHSWMGPSATRHWIGIINDDWRQIGFGDGMYHQPDPTNDRFEYGASQNGNIARLDRRTGDLLNIRPAAAGDEGQRFDWTAPILLSQHDPATVYLGGNRLYITRDRGNRWEHTDDLTKRIDRDTLTLMGVRGADIRLSRNDGTSTFGELTTIAESPLDPSVLWVGADDGNLQVSRDGGTTWNEVGRYLRGEPNHTYVSRVIASRRGPGVAYVTLDAHRDGDFAPYVYRTADFGRTWTMLTEGLSEGSVNVIREHHRNPDLLFLGTEHALYVSVNAGSTWTHWKANLPTTLFDDMVIHPRDNDLVLGTHGRSVWILDDLAPLEEWSASTTAAPVHLFAIRPATIQQYWKDTSYRSQAAYAGENPPDGAIVSFVAASGGTATLDLLNPAGDLVRQLEIPVEAGRIHRLAWDLRHERPAGYAEPDDATRGRFPHPVGPRGHFVSPGRYTARLTVGEATDTRQFEVRGDPRLNLTDASYESRERFLSTIAAALSHLETVRNGNGDSTVTDRANQLRRRLTSLYGQLNGGGVRQGSLYPPTQTQREQWELLRAELVALVENND